jgi:hypothetical protein
MGIGMWGVMQAEGDCCRVGMFGEDEGWSCDIGMVNDMMLNDLLEIGEITASYSMEIWTRYTMTIASTMRR